MNIAGKPYRTIWEDPDDQRICIIDQRRLPFSLVITELQSVDDAARAIAEMWVRGAGCIGATAGYGMVLAAREAHAHTDPSSHLHQLAQQLLRTRPTAVNLRWAVHRQLAALTQRPPSHWPKAALAEARAIAEEDVSACAAIGRHGLSLLRELAAAKPQGRPLNILTHCNAGWLAFVDHGSATAPIYAAHDSGLPVHVWVDETRPRSQGARLTAWELAQHGVPHTLITDNAGGHLMQRGQVDVVITGTDRTTRGGDVANKIGTYLKALAAHAHNIPFYVALPSSTFDWELEDGMEIPIEERSPNEVTHVEGLAPGDTAETEVRIAPETCAAANPAFDVTPRGLISALITERGVCAAAEDAIVTLFPERAQPGS